MTKTSIPFWLAVIMNMNVMIGAGVFINPSSLTNLTGSFGAFSYIVAAIVILPLVLIIAELSKINPAEEGALLVYSREGIGVKAGIFSAASYFAAKTVSIAILARVIAYYLQGLIPVFSNISTVLIMLGVYIVFGILNALGMKFGSKLQLGFMLFKGIPMLFIIAMLMSVFDINLISVASFEWPGFLSSIPVALYAILGFETCCAISHTIEGGAKNIHKAVLTSFVLVALICTSFQLSLYCKLGSYLSVSKTPLGDFIQSLAIGSPIFTLFGSAFVNLIIMVSMMGALYGIMQANNWNLFAISKELNFGPFTRINKFGIPWLCIIFQGIMSFMIASSFIEIVNLQRLTVAGIVICYLLSVIAMFRFYKIKGDEISLPKFVTGLGLVSCFYIVYNSIAALF